MIFNPCDIYLPARRADFDRWAVIACDQYTSQREYWDKVAFFVGNAPSALNIIQPEIDLDKADARLPSVHGAMETYVGNGTLKKAVENGFVLTLRETSDGLRVGLVGAVDLESYDYTPGTDLPVRASEKTITSRIPPRLKIREGALLEATHVLMLMDDPMDTVLGPLKQNLSSLRELYDFDLMLGGGHVRGYAVEGEEQLNAIQKALFSLYQKGEGFLFAVGDGNHSLATAKAYWEELKPTLTEEELVTHPARKALVELNNIHAESLIFKPIHRVLFGVKDMGAVISSYKGYLAEKGCSLKEGGNLAFVTEKGEKTYTVEGCGNQLDTVLLEPWFEQYAKEYGLTADYVHGDESLREVARGKDTLGILLGPIDKNALFPSIVSGGVLPRKSFSMGEANDKRFYIETRKIK